MRLLIFGGTTEGRILADRLSERGHCVTVSVATPLGAEELRGISCRILEGQLDSADMTELARRYDLVIDATHPYAREASGNIAAACGAAGVPMRRVLRDPSEIQGCVYTESCREAAEYLRERAGNILLTTGSKDLGAFAELAAERLFPRVLPTHDALDKCEQLGIPHKNILALQGPFSLEMNLAMIRQYQIRFLVTKDGGGAGGFHEKQEAAVGTGTELIVVGRPDECGISMEELLRELSSGTAVPDFLPGDPG